MGGKGVWRGGGGRLYTYRYTGTARMISALRWAAMRAILMFHNCERQSDKAVSTDHNFWRERKALADSNRGPSACQPNALLLGHTGSPLWIQTILVFIFAGVSNMGGNKSNAWYNLSCLSQIYCHLSSNEKLSVSWQFRETYGVTNYGNGGRTGVT